MRLGCIPVTGYGKDWVKLGSHKFGWVRLGCSLVTDQRTELGEVRLCSGKISGNRIRLGCIPATH